MGGEGKRMTKEDQIDKIIDEVEREFEKISIPIMDKLTLFAKVQNALYKCGDLTQEPKMGHWEWVQYDGNPNIGNWHCSECRTIVSRIPEVDNTPIYKWCPMCGCKMQEVENGKDND